MQERQFDVRLLNRKIVRCAVIEAPFVALGALLMAMGGPTGFYVGVGLLVVGSALAGTLVIRAVTRLDCPECGGACVRQGSLGFDCPRCDIRWRGNVPPEG